MDLCPRRSGTHVSGHSKCAQVLRFSAKKAHFCELFHATDCQNLVYLGPSEHNRQKSVCPSRHSFASISRAYLSQIMFATAFPDLSSLRIPVRRACPYGRSCTCLPTSCLLEPVPTRRFLIWICVRDDNSGTRNVPKTWAEFCDFLQKKLTFVNFSTRLTAKT